MRLRQARAWAVALATAASVTASNAQADGVELNRFSAAQTVEDGFTVSRPDDLGHLRLGLVLVLDYANDPLVLESRQGSAGSEVAAAVSDQLAAHAVIALGLWKRLVLFGGLDANLLMEGERHVDPDTGALVTTADGAGLGDGRAGARLRLLGEKDDALGLALQLTATLPLGGAVSSGQRYSGEESVTLLPELLAELRPGPVRLTANVGARVRPDANIGAGDAVEDELAYALGVTVPVVSDTLDLLVEAYGATAFADLGGRESSPFELLAGGKYWVAKSLAFGLAAGPGLGRGIGTPDFRIVGTLGWASCEAKEAAPEPEETPAEGDRDHDGLLDAADRCPDEPEDRDRFEDDDGCPDPDNDADGVLDDADECREEPEDRDEFDDADGCPEPDNDHDGIPDADDACPIAPGPKESDGCPRVRVEKGQILILDRVEFETAKDVLLSTSEPILAEVRDTLAANPQLKRVRVEGHTDDRGKDAYNMDLSGRRARSVARWLISHGIEDHRLEAYGCGETNPIESNDTPDGRQTNRRVEFHIIDPAPDEGIRSAVYCEPIAP